MPGLQASAASSSWANMASYGNYQPANVEGGGNPRSGDCTLLFLDHEKTSCCRPISDFWACLEHEHSRVQELLC